MIANYYENSNSNKVSMNVAHKWSQCMLELNHTS